MLIELKNENEIVKRCQAGDIGAYQQIYLRYSPMLLQTALRLLGNQQDAEDAVQTAFLKLYRYIHKFQFGSKFSTYLYRIMLNVCFNDLKKRKKDQHDALENVNLKENPQHDLKINLEAAITKLPEKMRICFTLFAIQGFKQEEIAEMLKLSVGTIKANIFHAKTRLKSALKDLEVHKNDNL